MCRQGYYFINIKGSTKFKRSNLCKSLQAVFNSSINTHPSLGQDRLSLGFLRGDHGALVGLSSCAELWAATERPESPGGMEAHQVVSTVY